MRTFSVKVKVWLVVLLALGQNHASLGFVVSGSTGVHLLLSPALRPSKQGFTSKTINKAWLIKDQPAIKPMSRQSYTRLFMYNLPPSPQGGGGPLRELLTGALTLVAIVAFFASPLGGIFFTILNSFFLLSVLTPFILWLGFQAWQFFYTVEGPCPNCGAPLRIAKDPNSPSFCLNCGTVVQATDDGNAIDFFYNDNLNQQQQVIVDDDYTSSIFDSFFGGGTRGVPKSYDTTPDQRQSKFRRETTIIDVEFEDDKN